MTKVTNCQTDKNGINIMNNKFRKKILIDFDGVLNDYDGNFNKNELPKIKEGAKEFIEKLNESADLYLFTTRNLMLSAKWLQENNIDKYLLFVC